jgi:hypothetical protein
MSGIKIGDRMEWHKIVSNYGHVDIIPVIIRKIGKRITVEAPLKNGGTKLVAVQPERLREVSR